ncbi:MAG: hypothetical protein V1492_02505 [Candidatus Micrarchaeota archaeon]
MFGIAGIRGVYGKEVTEELVLKISNLFASGDVAVGRDIRASGHSLKLAAIKGITAAGHNAFDLGIATTPTVALASRKYGLGIMITASHNPLDHNGIKLMGNGRELSPDECNVFAAQYKVGKQQTAASGKVFHDDSLEAEHIKLILKQVKPEKKLKVVADCNGAAYSITPKVLSALGCQVISINTSAFEFFRPSEPKKENLTSLAAAIRATNADLGIAHDADGDRCIILDRTGEQIPMDVQLAMMIEEELRKSSNKKIAATVEASLLIRETVEQNGGKVTITPVGSTYLALEMQRGAAFAGEPCGEYIYAAGVLAPDGVLAAAKFVELASKHELSELKKKYKTYPIARERYPTADREAAMKKIKAEVVRSYSKFSSLDGIRVDEEDGWFLVRASGTEKIIRLTMEYKDKAKLEKKKAEIEEIIKKSV